MKVEEIKNKTNDAVDYLVQSLESGHSEVLTQNTEDAKGTESTLFRFRAVYMFDRLSRDLRPSLCALDGVRL